MANKKLKRFSAMVRIDVVTDVDIKAESWEQALEKAKALKLEDACSLAGSYCDGEGVSLVSMYLCDPE